MIAVFAGHVEFLLTTHSIAVEWRATSGGRAWRRNRKVRIAPIKTAISYAVALHEIGHVLGRNPPARLDKEAAAWDWARKHALTWTPVMEKKMQRCLDSYARWAKRRHGVVKHSDAFESLRNNTGAL